MGNPHKSFELTRQQSLTSGKSTKKPHINNNQQPNTIHVALNIPDTDSPAPQLGSIPTCLDALPETKSNQSSSG